VHSHNHIWDDEIETTSLGLLSIDVLKYFIFTTLLLV